MLLTYPSGDRDVIARVLTDEAGKISVFARRNRSNRKQSGTALEALDRGTFDIGERRGDLHHLRSYRPISSYPQIRNSLTRLSVAATLLEAIDALVPEESGSDDDLLGILSATLTDLSAPTDDAGSFKICFETLQAAVYTCGYGERDLFGSASLHSLKKMLLYIERCTERRLKSKPALEDALSYFAKRQVSAG